MGKEGNGDAIVLTLAFMSEAERDAVYLNTINQVGIAFCHACLLELCMLFRVALLY